MPIAWCAVLLAVVGIAAGNGPQSADSTAQKRPRITDFQRDDPERKQAFEAFEQYKMSEAVPLLEKVVAKYPDDVVAHERLGVALLSRSATWSEKEKRVADRLYVPRLQASR